MANKIRVSKIRTICIADDIWEKARKLSVATLGHINVSGYFTYLINRESKRKTISLPAPKASVNFSDVELESIIGGD